MKQDPLLKTASILVGKLVSVKKQKGRRTKSLFNKAKELTQRIEEFESAHNLLNNI